jgi:hypothetical protein
MRPAPLLGLPAALPPCCLARGPPAGSQRPVDHSSISPHQSANKPPNRPRPSYILAVNSAILADTGGPCRDSDCTGPNKGPGCRFTGDPGFEKCVVQVRRSLVTATAATAAMSSVLMGAIANVPFAIMPGMGVNA